MKQEDKDEFNHLNKKVTQIEISAVAMVILIVMLGFIVILTYLIN